MKQIKIVIVGLGKVGQTFYEKFKEIAPETINIIALCENNLENPFLTKTQKDGITNHPDLKEMIDTFGEEIDIILDTSNNANVKKTIRQQLQKTNNQHTVLMPMIANYLTWYLLPNTAPIQQSHHKDIGY